jgi:C-terminal processing protease CtpA/Prc
MKPNNGKVYILADSRTSKTAEVLIYILKNKKIATIIGQKTVGAVMLAERISINNEYYIYLPVSEYYTEEGRSLNKIAIEPDIKVYGEDAMKYGLKTF